MTTRSISVDFLTSSFRISGKLGVTSAGVMGILTNTATSFIDVHEAHMSYVHAPSKLASQSTVLGVSKQKVAVICLGRREDVGPQAVFRGSYVRVFPYEVRVTTPVFQIEGTIEWSGRFTFTSIMAEDVYSFIPLFETVVQAIQFPSLRFESPAILFNRNYLETISLGSETI